MDNGEYLSQCFSGMDSAVVVDPHVLKSRSCAAPTHCICYSHGRGTRLTRSAILRRYEVGWATEWWVCMVSVELSTVYVFFGIFIHGYARSFEADIPRYIYLWLYSTFQ